MQTPRFLRGTLVALLAAGLVIAAGCHDASVTRDDDAVDEITVGTASKGEIAPAADRETDQPAPAAPGRAGTDAKPLRELREEVKTQPRDQDARLRKFATNAQARGDANGALAQSVPAAAVSQTARHARDQLAGLRAPAEPLDRENYAHQQTNSIKLTADHPVSTLSIDVDTGAYANVRRFLNEGRLPPQDAVRVEELINYFSYDYARPATPDVPFAVLTELGPSPWSADKVLLHIGLKGWEIAPEERPAANLVFLLDVSGSMNRPNKLPLLKRSFGMLVDQLNANDRVSMVVYAGASGVVLEPTPGDDRNAILGALDRLRAGGRTNGAAGIQLAYDLAQESFRPGGINRVLLATDGDFNVGTVNFEALKDMVERKREDGVALTTLGFGTGNYNDKLLEQLADAGNGNYAYIDNLSEARKVLVDQVGSTLLTIAKDVKVQIEFNPATVTEYRLIGYENRLLNRADFNNDKIDAGEIGAGHTVTALYELTLAGRGTPLIDPLRYPTQADAEPGNANEIGFLKLRYKAPAGERSKLMSVVIEKRSIAGRLRATSDDFRFAAAVAAFGQKLRGGEFIGDFDYRNIRELASAAQGLDPHEYRAEFMELVARADDLSAAQPTAMIAE